MKLVRSRAAALGAMAAIALVLPQNVALAHDGVDHGSEPGAEAALEWDNYEKILLTKNVGEPTDMAVMPDRTVLHTARNGEVRLTDPATGVTKVVSTIDVYANSEDGLQTVTLDPNFEENGWVYLYYAPRVMEGERYPTTTPTGSAPSTLPAGEDESYWDQWLGYNQLSRFKWDAEAQALDLSSEQKIIEVEVQRGQCCHVGGDVGFDGEGNLFLGTGDNTPAGAAGYTPINDAPGLNPGQDARRGAGSTNDLRGAILRIKVAEDGSYTIPEGNLFAPGTAGTRPELFVMGVRNPFRLDVDPATGAVAWGEYGPDAGAADPQRGPMGYVEWQSTTVPLNGGWPYCHGPNTNYNEWNFVTNTPGAWFDCEAGAKNNSRWNTGLDVLPPATAPQLWYGDRPGEQPWDELVSFDRQGGQAPMNGAVYRYDAENPSKTKLPEYWDGKAFMAEFSQDYIAALTLPDPDGPVNHIEHFLPNAALMNNGQAITDSPIDIEFGPDGSLYILDYGNGFFRQNPEAGLYRVDYAEGNKSPQATIKADVISSSTAPLTVTFDGSRSVDPEGETLRYEWDFNGDGTLDATGAQVTHTYTELGQYTVRLRVTDPEGKFGMTSQAITVGNVAPTITVDYPANGGFFNWGDAVPYRFSTSDPEDGNQTVCNRLRWNFGLGHDTHAHPEVLGSGCAGAWLTPVDAPEHGETEKLFGVVVATYTDGGNGDIPPATGETSLVLHPFVKEAEHADVRQGVEVAVDATAGALSKVTSFGAGDHLAYDPVNFTGIDGIEATVSGTGTLSLRWNSPDAAPFANVSVDGAGWQTMPVDIDTLPQGTGTLYVTSTGGVDVDRFRFIGAGVTDVTPPTVTHKLTPAAPGPSGWFTGPVSVLLNATDNGVIRSAEYSTDGGVTWTTALGEYWQFGIRQFRPLQLTEEGEHTVLMRATDTGGNVSEARTVSVKIDGTAPELTMTGVEDGATLGASEQLEVSVNASDAGSGVASTTVTLDGVALTGAVDLWTLDLGAHEIKATATDHAGNTTTRTVTFTVTTSLADLSSHVERLKAEGIVSAKEAKNLGNFLEQAQRHADAGRNPQAVKALERFTSAASVPLLDRDAEALIADLG